MVAGSPHEHGRLIANLLSETPCVHTTIRRSGEGCINATGRDTSGTLELIKPSLSLWLNTARAAQDLDGVVWQGRGLTAAGTGGIAIRPPIVELVLQPVVFVSQNAPYTPWAGTAAPDDFRDVTVFTHLDVPYRFGSGTYGRADPGESWFSVRGGPISAGVTTASQVWGPSHFYPLQIGAEGGGYPRVFVNLHAVRAFIGTVSGHYSVGRIESSGYARLERGNRTRIVPALAAVLSPRGVPGLELGGTRLFHVRWTRETVNGRVATLPFVGLLKTGNPTKETFFGDHNQTASVFARFAPPGSGVEAYGEFYREDHNIDVRDLAGEPDHASAYSVGIRRAWRAGDRTRAITIESANGRISHLQAVRSQGPPHTHGRVEEGHTVRGQPLAGSAWPGGGGMAASWHSIGANDSWVVRGEVRRTAQDSSTGWQGKQTGYVEWRVGRVLRRAGYWLGASVGLQHGYGHARETNVRLSLSLR